MYKSKKMFILKIEGLLEGTIVKRPSKLIKSPYVADANINNKEFLAHTAALGCCGLCETGSTILFAPMKNKDDLTKCIYSAQLAIIHEKNNEIIIGIHPKLAEQLAEKCLTNNYLSILKNVQAYKRMCRLRIMKILVLKIGKTNVTTTGHTIQKLRISRTVTGRKVRTL